MSKPAVILRFALVALCLASCTSDTKSASAPPPPPPPLPANPVPPVPVPAEIPSNPAEPVEEARDDESDEVAEPDSAGDKHDRKVKDDIAAEKVKGGSLYDLAKDGKATLPDAKPKPTDPKTQKPTDGKSPSPDITKPGVKPSEPPKPGTLVKPEPTKPEPAKPAGKVTIPSTKNVRIEVPKGMQELLDKDTRMGPWAKQVIDIADKCYATERKQNPLADGTIPVTITMHENERPDADVKKLPPELSGVVACATGKLMRVKMPLFTGPEGQKHAVKIVFTK